MTLCQGPLPMIPFPETDHALRNSLFVFRRGARVLWSSHIHNSPPCPQGAGPLSIGRYRHCMEGPLSPNLRRRIFMLSGRGRTNWIGNASAALKKPSPSLLIGSMRAKPSLFSEGTKIVRVVPNELRTAVSNRIEHPTHFHILMISTPGNCKF